eukprot:11200903-Lingulodinium_polyedra.AAC.1
MWPVQLARAGSTRARPIRPNCREPRGSPDVKLGGPGVRPRCVRGARLPDRRCASASRKQRGALRPRREAARRARAGLYSDACGKHAPQTRDVAPACLR